MEEEDERREAAIASAPSLQPNFRPVGVTQSQLTKFQQIQKAAKISDDAEYLFKDESLLLDILLEEELHRRRLHIKAGSKHKKRSKGISDEPGKSHRKHLDGKEFTDENSSKTIDDSSVSISKGNNIGDISSLQQDNVAVQVAPKKRQKLHWGLDTKERWERKANM